MHVDVTAVTIQSNNIVSNEGKDKSVPLEPSFGGKNELFGQPNIPYTFPECEHRTFTKISHRLVIKQTLIKFNLKLKS